MIKRLKKTNLGKQIHRFSKRSVMGRPLRKMLDLEVLELLNPAHLSPANMAHNRHQMAVLKKFEADLK